MLGRAHGWRPTEVTLVMGGEVSQQRSQSQQYVQAGQAMSVVLAMSQRPSAYMKGCLLFCAGLFVPCGSMGLILPGAQTSQEKSEIWVFM